MGIMMFIEPRTAHNNKIDDLNNKDESLYNKIGGENAVDQLAMMFYVKVLNDPELKHFFAHVDMLAQISHQKDYITHVLGGPIDYKGKSLREAHRHLSIKASDFDKTALHFVSCLTELDLPVNLTKEIMLIIETTRSEILNLDCSYK